MNDAALGQRIRRLREQRRWSQEQLADMLGVNKKSVSNWERGRNDPRNSIGALSEIFGVELDGGGEVPAADLVEAALRGSGLDEWRQVAVLSEYKRHLQEQRAGQVG